jgi:glutamate formiminotransferase/glutamate formiminotransferase/formiminotetrahydrofolate cyclodeaminase
VKIVECVPNFSEGRDELVIGELAGAAGRLLLDRTSDPDHNRTVLTLAGPPEEALEAALRTAAIAVERIDLGRHAGVHPRIGSLDVLPFVPIEETSLDECAALAHRAGERIWRELRVPVFFYEAAALRSEMRNLAEARSGRHNPDLGGPSPHATAGMTAVGARKPLVAYNVTLGTADLEIAKQIARAVRASSGGLRCVKALGLALASRGLVQVSMNLTDYEITPPHVAFQAVGEEAKKHGVEVLGSELIGLIPRKALEAPRGIDLRWENLHPESVLETRLASWKTRIPGQAPKQS